MKQVGNSNLVVPVVCHFVTSAVAPVLSVVLVVFKKSVVVKNVHLFAGSISQTGGTCVKNCRETTTRRQRKGFSPHYA